MCGIAGFYSKNIPSTSSYDVLRKMGNQIESRGPDSSGEWLNSEEKVGFAHRRLAILDISESGSQPMTSQSKNFTIVFNGEIYNHLELRALVEKERKNFEWIGFSDTETILACLDVWGVTRTLSKLVGMFAFAVWDEDLRKLTLCRDRMGEKPLYYGWQQDEFLFGSELKALKAHPKFVGEIDRRSLALLLRYSYIPSPNSIYLGISKLSPGHYLEVDLEKNTCNEYKYENAEDLILSGKHNSFNGTEQEALEKLEGLLKKAVKSQMLSDVSIGAFLSGGVDSSLVVSLMQSQSETPIKTFSIGFQNEAYDEAVYAKKIAEHLGTEHTEVYVKPEDALNVISLLPQLFDEPFADSSQIPTYLVSKIASQHVTVALSGDAGDEVFCGYNRYIVTDKTWRSLARLPLSVRAILSKLITLLPMKYWDALNKALPFKHQMSRFGEKMHKGAAVLTSNSLNDLYTNLVSNWREPESVVLGVDKRHVSSIKEGASRRLSSDIEHMMLLDTLCYLPDDILAKVDRAAMGVSLETRVPFLDRDLVRFAWSLPLNQKIRDGVAKWCLKKILYKYVPKELIERPKMGFSIPLAEWLRGPLKPWAEELLDCDKMKTQGYLDSSVIRELWLEHLSGRSDKHSQLWPVLMFQQWLEHNEIS
ncbi:asparagine synthase (glutamine-hydrolyzing) [Vibrio sp. J383]|uniref:asparagine synthase (glutamine-hydrolyzing) n=1 Tax=Vibrio sp. J383 TaxID=2942997 RepID=UPI0020BF8BF1|nr:asparagine synthase (glutamine-hydrolyzing) [Vibrio sp. J383]UQV21860.1 asparagine synthase (glutamine-hydrolyzing) [Vibrio sp. J383]